MIWINTQHSKEYNCKCLQNRDSNLLLIFLRLLLNLYVFTQGHIITKIYFIWIIVLIYWRLNLFTNSWFNFIFQSNSLFILNWKLKDHKLFFKKILIWEKIKQFRMLRTYANRTIFKVAKEMINNFLMPGKCFYTNYKTLWIIVLMKMQFYPKYFYSFLRFHTQKKITKTRIKQQLDKSLKY